MIRDFASLTMTIAPGLLLIIILSAAAILLFELCMLVHVIRNRYITTNRKVLWIIGMFLLHPFVALGYLFTDFRKTKK